MELCYKKKRKKYQGKGCKGDPYTATALLPAVAQQDDYAKRVDVQFSFTSGIPAEREDVPLLFAMFCRQWFHRVDSSVALQVRDSLFLSGKEDTSLTGLARVLRQLIGHAGRSAGQFSASTNLFVLAKPRQPRSACLSRHSARGCEYARVTGLIRGHIWSPGRVSRPSTFLYCRLVLG